MGAGDPRIFDVGGKARDRAGLKQVVQKLMEMCRKSVIGDAGLWSTRDQAHSMAEEPLFEKLAFH